MLFANRSFVHPIEMQPPSEPGSPPAETATHRGFSRKAREVLLDPPQCFPKSGTGMPRKYESDSDLRRQIHKTNSVTAFGLRQNDSGAGSSYSNESRSPKSGVSSAASFANELDFDGIGDFSKPKPHLHKYLGELGKTQSAGDLFIKGRPDQNPKLVRSTMKQLNLLKLPSLDSDLENAEHFRVLALRDSLMDSVGFTFSEYGLNSMREQRYEVAKTMSRDGTRATREQLTDSQKIHDSSTWLPTKKDN